jgi:hypothetical protein
MKTLDGQIENSLQREIKTVVKKLLMTPNQMSSKAFMRRQAKKYFKTHLDILELSPYVTSAKKSHLPRKLKKKRKKEGMISLDIIYTPPVALTYLELKGTLIRG